MYMYGATETVDREVLAWNVPTHLHASLKDVICI